MTSTSAPNTICVLRLSAIGDCINAYAVITQLQQTFPNAQITWIIGKAESSLFTGMQKLGNLTIVPFDKSKGFKENIRLRNLFKNTVFDVMLDMQSALRASILSLCIKAKVKYGFDKVRATDWQTLFTDKQIPSPSQPHVLDGFLAFGQQLGCPILPPTWDFQITKEEELFAQQLIPTTKNIILSPCSSKVYKNWSLHGYIEICRYAIDKGFNVYLTGGNKSLDKETAQEIMQGVNNNEHCVNLMGKTSLRQMLALIKRCDMLIAPDSGPIHMANALNVPVLGIYAHHNPLRVGPYNFLKYSVSIFAECLALETSDPQKVHWHARVHDKHAMLKISSAMVREKFNQICTDFHLI